MSTILNKDELLESNSKLRGYALEILEEGYLAINTEKILRKQITLEEDGALCIEDTGFQCSFYERIFFIGIGKCALEGARVIENILGDKLTAGITLDVKAGILQHIKSYVGTHPYTSEANVLATKQILKMIEGVTERDLVLVLISGGGSSLFTLPTIPINTLTKITKDLTKKGADIYELNTVRKHFSEVQGGGLAKLCYPAQVVSLIFSDVLGNDIEMVASGPTVLDTTTTEDAKKILEKYQISEIEEKLLETPKDSVYFKKIKNVLVCSNQNALEAMKIKAEALGFNTEIETTKLAGNASQIGESLALREPRPNTCILFGGETTIKIKGDGIGGRNQEMALSALPYMMSNSILVCTASDGWDNTNHAGAIADKELFEKTKQLGLSPEKYLEENNSYAFFKKVGGWLYTGKLESNVSDLYIMLYGGR